MQRLADSNRIASSVRDILSRRRRHRPQHVSEFPAARVHLGWFSRQAQPDTAGAVGTQQVGQASANSLPDLGSVRPWIMIETDGDDICRGLQHLVAANASGRFHHSCHRHWQQDRLATFRPRNPEDLIDAPLHQDRCQRTSAGASPVGDQDAVTELVPNHRLDIVGEIRHQEPV